MIIRLNFLRMNRFQNILQHRMKKQDLGATMQMIDKMNDPENLRKVYIIFNEIFFFQLEKMNDPEKFN